MGEGSGRVEGGANRRGNRSDGCGLGQRSGPTTTGSRCVRLPRLPARRSARYTAAVPLPIEPHPTLVPFAPTARRTLSVFGASVELVFVPERKARQDRATAERPAFRRSPAARIVGEEAFWRGEGHLLTPNRHPFAAAQRLLWPDAPRREPDAAFWQLCGDWAARSGGSALVNSVGAAATIARCHAHLVPERLPFLDALSERPFVVDLVDRPAGVALVTKHVPFCLLGVRGGDSIARAETLVRLAEARLTAAHNVVLFGDSAWLLPRRLETPAPDFPYPLGAAELWGRWCYQDEEPFAAATPAMLERALQATAMPQLPE